MRPGTKTELEEDKGIEHRSIEKRKMLLSGKGIWTQRLPRCGHWTQIEREIPLLSGNGIRMQHPPKVWTLDADREGGIVVVR